MATPEHPPYPVNVQIVCPKCGAIQTAQKHFYVGEPFPDLVHQCGICHYWITESEWQEESMDIKANFNRVT